MSTPLNEDKYARMDEWQIFTLKDAFAHRDPIEYVVKNLFEVPSLNIVYGAPGSFKSMLLADLTCCAVNGENWLVSNNGGPVTGLQVKKTGALWIDFDNGQRRTHDRFAALGKAHKLNIKSHLKYVSVPTPWLNAGNEEHMEDLATIIKQIDVGMVVFDNLAAIVGSVDENSPAMADIFYNLRWLSEEAKVAIVIIHHARKTNPAGSRKGESLRGHSSIEGSVDLALFVNRQAGTNIVTLEPTKVRGPEIPKIAAQFVHRVDKYGQLNYARFITCDKVELETPESLMRSIISCLGEKTINQSQLTEKVQDKDGSRFSNKQVHKAISLLTEKGYLLEAKGPRNAKLLTINKEKNFVFENEKFEQD